MNKDNLKLLSATIGLLTLIQGFGTALGMYRMIYSFITSIAVEASTGTLVSLFLGLNLMLVGVWLILHEYNPFAAPFDMVKWTPFLQSMLGKAFLYQFLAFLSVGTYFGPFWNTFAFWWQLIVAVIFGYNHFNAHQLQIDTNQDSLLLHDYQKLDVQAM